MRTAPRSPTTTAADGTFAFDNVEPGSYEVAIGAATFAQPFNGVSWLGPRLITPSIIIAYLWIWAGFSMVVIAAGLAAIPRDVLRPPAPTEQANGRSFGG